MELRPQFLPCELCGKEILQPEGRGATRKAHPTCGTALRDWRRFVKAAGLASTAEWTPEMRKHLAGILISERNALRRT